MRVVSNFLKFREIDLIDLVFRNKSRQKVPGRQGTGYYKLDVKGDPLLMSIAEKSLKELGIDANHKRWDNYLLVYPDGSYVPTHKDETDLSIYPGKRHIRLNALVRPANFGGILTVDGEEVTLKMTDAIVFYPDEQEHSVSPVKGERIVWTVGALI